MSFCFPRYYLATVPNDPAQQHLFSLSTSEKDPKAECLSCEVMSETSGTPCLYNDAKLSPDKSRYILTCAGPSVPDVSIYSNVSCATNERTLAVSFPSTNSHGIEMSSSFFITPQVTFAVGSPAGPLTLENVHEKIYFSR